MRRPFVPLVPPPPPGGPARFCAGAATTSPPCAPRSAAPAGPGPAPVPVIWVLTARPAPGTALADLADAAEQVVPVTRLSLGRLAPADIDALARDRLGEEPGPPVRALLRGVDGNPFWALQVLDGLA